MKKIIITILALAVSGAFVGCYNDFDAPAPAKVWTDADFGDSKIISIEELKGLFTAAYPGTSGIGKSLEITDDLVIRGKVISSDRQGNVYKSLYIYDAECEQAIELKLTSGNYLEYPVGRMVYVRLKDLVLGNYRSMISVGTWSTNASYANGNIESRTMLAEHILSGAQVGLTAADTLVVNSANYQSLTDASLGRLVRFEGVESMFGTAGWGYRNTFPNYFANSTSYDVNSPGWGDINDWATWAARRDNTYYYGSAWFSYGNVNTLQGNYVVRSSGYSRFRDQKIPADGSIVDITAIYTKFSPGDDSRAAYQLLLNTALDVKILSEGR